MSRCFPYPPPGFEPKLTNDHADLLHKEKHKDKKHKKEKKDKRESKEKREKDKHHSKEKHKDSDKDKEKKERKEKHKHKKKEKERDKESDKEKHRTQSVPSQVPTDKVSENSRIHIEHSRRANEGPQAGPGSQSIERRVASTSTYGASEKRPIPDEHSRRADEGPQAGPGSQSIERRVAGTTYGASEKRPVPVPVQQSVPSVHKKSNDTMKVGPTNHSTNHRPTIASERRVPVMPSTCPPEEGMLAKRTVSSASNPTLTNPNSLPQRKSNGPPKQVANHHGTVNTERRVVGNEAKKPVPSPYNSLQGKSNGPSNQSTNHHQLPVTNSMQNRVTASERSDEAKRVAGNSVVQMQRKTDGPTFQVTNNHQAIGLNERRVSLNQSVGPTSTPEKEKNRDKSGLNLSRSDPGSVKQEEGKKEKRKDRDERKKEKEQRRLEKRQRKEREREEREKKKERERDKVKEVGGSMARPSIEGPQKNIEKVGATDGFLSKKRKEGPSNGFLHEGDLRAQKLVRTSPPDTLIKKDASSNGFVQENDVGSTKLTIRLPPHPPPLENGRTADHPPPLLSPPIMLTSSSPQIPAASNTLANNNTIKAEVPSIKKAPYLNGMVPDAKLSKKRKEEPPHPDVKYLNVVYSVPKLEEKELMPPLDDQEWLFGTKPNRNPNLNPNSKMPEYGLSQGSGQVWDRAVLLDSADALALPYVVPF